MRRLIFTLLLAALVVGAVPAHAGTMVLTSGGDLYKVWAAEEGLVLSHSAPGRETEEALIPQTLGMTIDGVVLTIDERTETALILWTDATRPLSSVRLAALVDGAWYGPVILEGEDGTTLTNADAMIDIARTVIEPEVEGDEPEILETTFLHTVWWRHDNVTALGHAVYTAIPLSDDGMPELPEAQTYDLENLLPFGFGCDDNPDVAGLTSARFFVGDDGHPQIFTPDFADCSFFLLDVEYDIEEVDIPGTNVKRRRQIAVFRTGDVVMAIPPNIDLAESKMFLGHDDNVLIYWDGVDTVDWVLSNTDGWTVVNSIPLGGDIDHEQAVELLRALAR